MMPGCGMTSFVLTTRYRQCVRRSRDPARPSASAAAVSRCSTVGTLCAHFSGPLSAAFESAFSHSVACVTDGDVLGDGPPRSLPSAANPFGVAWGENSDACIRLGSWFEPIINCNGLWYNGGFNDYPATPSATHSAMWLSILDADLPLQLTFLLMENSWVAPGALRNDGWLQTVAVQTWGAEARMLAPSFYPTFGLFPPEPHRYVSVEKATLLQRDVAPDSTPVRARAWREL
eukprot:68205_2